MGDTTMDVVELAEKAPADLYILTGDEIPFIQDGLRDGEHIRHAMHKRFLEELGVRDIPFIEVRGSIHERVRKATEAIEALPKKTIQLYKEEYAL